MKKTELHSKAVGKLKALKLSLFSVLKIIKLLSNHGVIISNNNLDQFGG